MEAFVNLIRELVSWGMYYVPELLALTCVVVILVGVNTAVYLWRRGGRPA
jgi:hypothetical protein